jgi:hypothetical protein
MTNKDKGQFMAEIKMIGLQKEFKGLFGEMINPINLIKEVDDILETRKTSYNYAFVKCCEKNSIRNIDNIYKDLEKFWTEPNEELGVLKADLSSALTLIFSGPLGLLGSAIGTYQTRISEKWEQYIQETVKYAETLDDMRGVKG